MGSTFWGIMEKKIIRLAIGEETTAWVHKGNRGGGRRIGTSYFGEESPEKAICLAISATT